MNCLHCNDTIEDGAQVQWNNGNYHAACVSEAVALHRTQTEPSAEEMVEVKEALEDFENEFPNDFDEFEDLLEEAEEFEPVAQVNESPVIVMPPGAQIVAPRAIIHPPIENGSKLMVHCGAQRIERNELSTLAVPESTSTFQPVRHDQLVDIVEEALAFRHIRITGSEFAVSPDGMKLFAVLRVNADYEGVGFAIGLRNANDKSMRLGIVSGYRVFCCDNLAFSGDFNPMLAKHSKNLDLVEGVSIAIDRIQRQWQPLRTAIDFKRQHELGDTDARNLLYRLFTDYKFPVSLFRTVHQEYFVKPSYEDFSDKTLWSLENALTTSFKKLKPIAQYETTAKLGRFISDYIKSV
jgi:hypothetical protein